MNAKRDFFETIRLGITLALYATAACAILAAVNNSTAARIRQNKIEKATAAMKEVFSDADEFLQVQDFLPAENSSVTIQGVYVAKSGGKKIGGVVQVSGPTYDRGTIMVGMTDGGKITGMRFLELSDSPGFGLKANDATFKLPGGKTFYGQFEGKSTEEKFSAGKNFDAISGATITSVAVGNLMNEGIRSLKDVLNSQE
jgi:electron transport complex protein RnfG